MRWGWWGAAATVRCSNCVRISRTSVAMVGFRASNFSSKARIAAHKAETSKVGPELGCGLLEPSAIVNPAVALSL
ncbi:hypothetical protein TIFTF001_001928 [Ficus carica]|uniref:Uncharacterized protein n=1 Tax=Ficus carica TaxID=3494 RepID=A0AA87Z980_FICCA|nr:hypothetical protein TIFTF001_001928 [Ficus carica]